IISIGGCMLRGTSASRSHPPLMIGFARPVAGSAWLVAPFPPKHHERDDYGSKDRQEDRHKRRPAAGEKVREHFPGCGTYVDIVVKQWRVMLKRTGLSSPRLCLRIERDVKEQRVPTPLARADVPAPRGCAFTLDIFAALVKRPDNQVIAGGYEVRLHLVP